MLASIAGAESAVIVQKLQSTGVVSVNGGKVAYVF